MVAQILWHSQTFSFEGNARDLILALSPRSCVRLLVGVRGGVHELGLRVWGLGFEVWGLGLWSADPGGVLDGFEEVKTSGGGGGGGGRGGRCTIFPPPLPPVFSFRLPSGLFGSWCHPPPPTFHRTLPSRLG